MNIVFSQETRNKARAIVRAAPGYPAWRTTWGPGRDLTKAAIIAGAQALGVWPAIEALLKTQTLGRRRTPMPEILNDDGFVPDRPIQSASAAFAPAPPPLPDIMMLTEIAILVGLDPTTVSAAFRKLGCPPRTIRTLDGRRHHAWLRADIEKLLALPRRARGGFVIGSNGAARPAPAPVPGKTGVIRGGAFLALDRALENMSAAIDLLTEAFGAVAGLVAALGKAEGEIENQRRQTERDH